MPVFQEQNRQEIREAIGYITGDMILVEATSTVGTASLIATYSLARGGDDEYNGRQVVLVTKVGSIALGEKSFVNDFAIATFQATCAPVFTSSIADGDVFEMWKVFTYEEINQAINNAILEAAAANAFVDRVTEGNFTRSGEYSYDWLTPYAFGLDFKALSKVEYVAYIGIAHDIELCETAWDELVDDEVTADVDTTYNVEGTNCLELTITADAEADDILATQDISAVDISDCDKVEITIRSTVALDAGDIQLLLDNTAACASAVESLDIPVTSANTTTTHVISLANPSSDTAIISVGIKLITDKGAMTLYADRIKAVNSHSKKYEILNPEHWFITKGSSPTLGFTQNGLSVVGANTEVRLTGYASPDIFTDDSTDSEVDPSWLINKVAGELMLNHAKSASLQIPDRVTIARYRLEKAEKDKALIRFTPSVNTRYV